MDEKQALENNTVVIVAFISAGSLLKPFLVLPGHLCILSYSIMSSVSLPKVMSI